MVQIEPRSAWGPEYANGDRTLDNVGVGVYVHHTDTKYLPATATVAEERTQMKAIEQIGEDQFGSGISYNVVVFPSGRAYEGVSMNRRGTHTGGLNSTVRSICFAGNYETNRPTPAQLATAAAIFQEGQGKWWTPAAYVKGHRDQKATICPGRHVYSQLAVIKGGPIDTTPAPKPPKLDVDGFAGTATTRALQALAGNPQDGVISGQPKSIRTTESIGRVLDKHWPTIQYGSGGSLVIAWLQKQCGVKVDRFFGRQTVSALQRKLGVSVDGSPGPRTVKALQQAINNGRL